MRLLLDSHVLLWALYEPEKLTKTVSDLVGNTSNELFVSDATVWELANKAAANRLPLVGSSVPRLIERIEQLGVSFVPITQQDIVSASTLPPHHADPFDRILIAQAQANSLQLVSKDKAVSLYDVETLWR